MPRPAPKRVDLDRQPAGPCLEDTDPCQAEAAGCPGGEADVADLSSLSEMDRLWVLGALTARFSAAYLRWMRSRAGDVLSYSNLRVMELLETRGPTIMREVAAALGMTPRNMTAIIDTLEEGGLVRRDPHPHDRRATVVALTEQGRREAERIRAEAVGWVADAFNSLSLEEQQRYATTIMRLGGYFGA